MITMHSITQSFVQNAKVMNVKVPPSLPVLSFML